MEQVNLNDYCIAVSKFYQEKAVQAVIHAVGNDLFDSTVSLCAINLKTPVMLLQNMKTNMALQVIQKHAPATPSVFQSIKNTFPTSSDLSNVSDIAPLNVGPFAPHSSKNLGCSFSSPQTGQQPSEHAHDPGYSENIQ